ncbi:MAG: hypothetical protein AB9846_05355 [Tenuifilaceae bacterium]
MENLKKHLLTHSKTLRMVHFLILVIFLNISVFTFAQTTTAACDTITVSSKDTDIYKLIVGGKEDLIKNYFSSVAFDVLVNQDNGAIVRAITRLNSNNKVTHTIWILNGIKNSTVDVRSHVYTELEKIEYGKLSFVLKTLVNNFFVNYNEEELTLKRKVDSIQKKMVR